MILKIIWGSVFFFLVCARARISSIHVPSTGNTLLFLFFFSEINFLLVNKFRTPYYLFYLGDVC